MELASIQDPLGNAIHTLTGGPVKDATIAIHGLGPIGLFAVNAAKAMGAKLVIAIDWDNQTRMELAKKLGADVVLGKDHDIVQTIMAHTNGRVWIIVVSFQALLMHCLTQYILREWEAMSMFYRFMVIK